MSLFMIKKNVCQLVYNDDSFLFSGGTIFVFLFCRPGERRGSVDRQGAEKDKAGKIGASESSMTHPQGQKRAAFLKDM